MGDKKIAIIYTTFKRPELARRTLQSVFDHMPKNSHVFIGDQSGGVMDTSMWKNNLDKSFFYGLNFDCGLSHARNFLVERAALAGFEYCLVTADSIEFTEKTINLDPVIEFLELYSIFGIVGFDLNGRIPWEYLLDLEDNRFVLRPASEVVNFNGMDFTECDICRNFFLAKTSALMHVKWDNNLKMAEHEDFFWRFKLAGYKAFHTSGVQANYINSKPPEYAKYRDRLYGEFKQRLMQKYNLKKWFVVTK